MSLYTAAYKFSTTTTAGPPNSQMRLDAGFPYTTATTLWVHRSSADGVDLHAVLLTITAPDELVLQDKTAASDFGRFVATGAAVDVDTYVAIPIAWSANGNALANNAQSVFGLITSRTNTPDLPPPIPVGPVLVTLDDAKTHLLLPLDDPTPDADLTAKLRAAEAAILDYIGSTAYWRDVVATWVDPITPVAAPAFVSAAILLQLGELWRWRGDDEQNQIMPRRSTDPPDFLPAIIALLRRTRDPVLA